MDVLSSHPAEVLSPKEQQFVDETPSRQSRSLDKFFCAVRDEMGQVNLDLLDCTAYKGLLDSKGAERVLELPSQAFSQEDGGDRPSLCFEFEHDECFWQATLKLAEEVDVATQKGYRALSVCINVEKGTLAAAGLREGKGGGRGECLPLSVAPISS